MRVESRYFFGGAVNNADVEWTVVSSDYFFDYAARGYWDFINLSDDGGPGDFYDIYNEEIASGSGTTNEQGVFMLSLPSNLGARPQSQTWTIEARITDESDQLVAGRAQVVVHQGEVYLGLQPENYIGVAGDETNVNLVSVDWEGDPVPSQVVEYRVVERRWSNVQEEDELGRTVFTWEVEEIEIPGGTGDLATDAQGQGQITFVPPLGGVYRVYATTRDDLGNPVRTSTYLWVTGENYVSWRQQNANTFDLITDADEYRVGDTAEILIASPFQGETTALITIERNGVLSYDVMRMEKNSAVYRLPITDDFAPNVFVSVMLVKGVDEFNPFAEFRMGLTQLAVDTQQLALNVEVTPNVDVAAGEFAGPGNEVTYTVRTTDWQGEPVSAEVGISVTDLAVLTIAPPNSGSLMEYFYSQRGISVRTSTPLTVSVDKATQTIIDTVKGGGGGGGEQGIFDIREEFVDTPGWEPSLVTDENGLGTFALTLPDNLTTWRLDARAVTATTPLLVGQTTTDLLSTLPLLIRPVTPRFLIVGDVVEFGAVVNNNTGSPQSVAVSLQGTGFELDPSTPITQTVEILAGARARVNWRASVLDVPAIDLTFLANGNNGEFTDASKPPLGLGDERLLPVYKYQVPETVGTAGVLREEGSRSEIIALPRWFEVSQGELTVNIDRSLAGVTLEGLDYLQNFPYQCIEQTVSRFLPNVITLRAFQQLGVEDASLEADLNREVNFALQRLYAQQKSNGGWGWFPQSETNPVVTAYAVVGLVEARNNGYPVADNVINRAVDYLEGRINDFPRNPQRHIINRQSLLLYAVTLAGSPNESAASNLLAFRSTMNNDAKAFLALTLLASPNFTVAPGSVISYTLRVKNHGDGTVDYVRLKLP
ncbi:MAG: hypothetical protein HC915_11445, partial [Anaerolineae bacterium]|nr:hypothetical protein [Anaerolineae bacterium]